MTDTESTNLLDTSGLLCPEPLMLLHQAIRDMATGQCITVIATDPSTLRDIPKFCHYLQHQLLFQQESDEHYRFTICKGPPKANA